jgi:hypothetical protein
MADTTGMPRSRDNANLAQRTTAQILRAVTGALAALKLSPSEEAFFREGERIAEASDFDFSDLDAGRPKQTRWRAVVGWFRGVRLRRNNRQRRGEPQRHGEPLRHD